jgi:hypothetical protein
MNQTKYWAPILLLIVFFSSILSCSKQQDEWIVLFDGSSTDAWRCYLRDDFPSGGWAIEDGALKTIVGGDQCDIITKDSYDDFELELEWKVSPGGNSGIFYRVIEDTSIGEVWESAPEMQVLDDDVHNDGGNPKTSAGALYALIAPQNKVLAPVGEFNKARIVVKGNYIEHWLNNVKIVAYDLSSDSLKSLIAESKFKDLPQFATAKSGTIALQHHGQEVWFRNIRIRPLPE